MNKTVLMMLAAATLVVQNGLAYDDPDEFEAALARATQSKPRLKAAGATLLSETGDDNTYWATGDLNVTRGHGQSINLQFEISKTYTHISSATLTLNAYDVDSSSTERDEVYFNGGTHVGTLSGGNNIWHVNTFRIPASAIHTGINNLRIDVDLDTPGHWVTRIEYAKLVIDGEVYSAPSNLSATQYHNQHPLGVKLTWSAVANAPGYIVVRQIVGEDRAKAIAFVEECNYIDEVRNIPNCKDLKANYCVVVAERQVDSTPIVLSPYSNVALGSWHEKLPPRIELIAKEPSAFGSNAPMLSGLKGANVCTLEFNSGYDKNRYVFKEARIKATSGSVRRNYTSSTPSVTIDIPAGMHGVWSFIGHGIFTDVISGAEYTTPPFELNNVRVCFKRIGRDGVKVSGVRVNGKGDAPNWFKYWKRDGALLSLSDDRVHYDARPFFDFVLHGMEDSFYIGGYTSMATGKVYIRDSAILLDFSSSIRNGNKTVTLHTPNAPSILKCAEVVKHELGHSQLWLSRGGVSGRIFSWLIGGDDDSDGLPNTLEDSCSFLPFKYDDPDTFNFVSGGFSSGYKKKNGDEEVYVRYLATKSHNETYFSSVLRPYRDFSWESSDNPMRGKSMLTASPAKTRATSSEVWSSGSLDDLTFFSGNVGYESPVVIHNVSSIVATPSITDAYSGLDICVNCVATTNTLCVVVVTLTDENDEPVA